MNRFRFRAAIVTVAAAAAVGVGVSPALAVPDDTNVTVAAGTLSITDPAVANFPDVTLNGTAQTADAAVDSYTINDATGSGSGWKVTLQATQLTEWDSTLNAGAGDYVTTTPRTFATSSLSLPAPTVTSPNTTSTDPTISTGPYSIDAAGAVTVASAAVDTGMGEYVFTAGTLTVSVPTNAYAAAYRSDVTLSVVTGP